MMLKLPDLTYSYESLNRSISGDVMRLHHDKHHQTYVDKLNAVIDANPDLQGRSIEDILINISSLSESIRNTVRNMGGGHYNHSFFWLCMSPNGGGLPVDDLYKLIANRYGDFQKFVDEFTSKSLSLFGSGWVWLQPNGDIITTQNQDTPIAQGLDSPLLCLDVWEHAYYLDYKNRRDEYIKAWWNVVDWASVSARYSDYLVLKK